MMKEEDFMEELYSYVPFKIDQTIYAVSAEYVDFIASTEQLLPKCAIPHMPKFVDSVVLYSGESVAVIELSDVYKKPRAIMLMLYYNRKRIGVLADNVEHLISLTQAELRKDTVSGQEILTNEDRQYVFFDVPEFYKSLIE